jgi:hypothetical protein
MLEWVLPDYVALTGTPIEQLRQLRFGLTDSFVGDFC